MFQLISYKRGINTMPSQTQYNQPKATVQAVAAGTTPAAVESVGKPTTVATVNAAVVSESDGQKLLANDKALRDKISPEALNAIGPKGLSEDGRKLLADDKVLRDKISAEALSAIEPPVASESPSLGASFVTFFFDRQKFEALANPTKELDLQGMDPRHIGDDTCGLF
jgi:hypothetical protein